MKEEDVRTVLALREHASHAGTDTSEIDSRLEQLAVQRLDGLSRQTRGESEGVETGRLMLAVLFSFSLAFGLVTALLSILLESEFYAKFTGGCVAAALVSAFGYIHLKADDGVLGAIKGAFGGK